MASVVIVLVMAMVSGKYTKLLMYILRLDLFLLTRISGVISGFRPETTTGGGGVNGCPFLKSEAQKDRAT